MIINYNYDGCYCLRESGKSRRTNKKKKVEGDTHLGGEHVADELEELRVEVLLQLVARHPRKVHHLLVVRVGLAAHVLGVVEEHLGTNNHNKKTKTTTKKKESVLLLARDTTRDKKNLWGRGRGRNKCAPWSHGGRRCGSSCRDRGRSNSQQEHYPRSGPSSSCQSPLAAPSRSTANIRWAFDLIFSQ